MFSCSSVRFQWSGFMPSLSNDVLCISNIFLPLVFPLWTILFEEPFFVAHLRLELFSLLANYPYSQPVKRATCPLSHNLFLHILRITSCLHVFMDRVSLLNIMLSTKFSYKCDKEHLRIITYSSSSIFTSLFFRSIIVAG